MKFSIIVPIYNVEKYIDDCVMSVLNQTFIDFELILVNDGSTDNSYEKCLKWKDKDNRILVVNQNNKWLSGARNAGIDIAKGEYIIFLDGDDMLNESALSILNQHLDNDKLLIFGYSYINENNDLISNQTICLKHISSLRVLKKSFAKSDKYGSAWIKCVSRKYFDGTISHIRFDENTRFAEDQIYTCDLLNCATEIIVINESLYLYRQRNGSIMHNYNIKKISYISTYLSYIETNFKHNDIPNFNINLALCNRKIYACVNEVLEICKLNKKYKEKKALFKQLVSNELFHKKGIKCDSIKLSVIYLLSRYKMFWLINLIYNILR